MNSDRHLPVIELGIRIIELQFLDAPQFKSFGSRQLTLLLQVLQPGGERILQQGLSLLQRTGVQQVARPSRHLVITLGQPLLDFLVFLQ